MRTAGAIWKFLLALAAAVEVVVAPGTWTYTSTSCAPSGLPKVSLRFRVWSLKMTSVSAS